MIWRKCKRHAINHLAITNSVPLLTAAVVVCLRALPPSGGCLLSLYTSTAEILRWYMARVICGPLFLAVCRNYAVCSNLLEHLQVLPLRLAVQITVGCLCLGLQPVSKLPAATLLEDLHDEKLCVGTSFLESLPSLLILELLRLCSSTSFLRARRCRLRSLLISPT